MTLEDVIRERFPHAPQLGLYVRPDLPESKLEHALSDYGREVDREEVVALYDATLTGTGGDGALFTSDRMVFQNNDFQSVQTVHYRDVVGVEAARRWWGLGGKTVDLSVNRGRATFDLSLDCSGVPEAAEYIADVLHAVMLEGVEFEAEVPAAETDVAAVRQALDRLRRQQKLTAEDFERLMELLERSS